VPTVQPTATQLHAPCRCTEHQSRRRSASAHLDRTVPVVSSQASPARATPPPLPAEARGRAGTGVHTHDTAACGVGLRRHISLPHELLSKGSRKIQQGRTGCQHAGTASTSAADPQRVQRLLDEHHPADDHVKQNHGEHAQRPLLGLHHL